MTTLSRSCLLSAIEAAERAGRNHYSHSLRVMYRREFGPTHQPQKMGCSPHVSQGICPVEKVEEKLLSCHP